MSDALILILLLARKKMTFHQVLLSQWTSQTRLNKVLWAESYTGAEFGNECWKKIKKDLISLKVC